MICRFQGYTFHAKLTSLRVSGSRLASLGKLALALHSTPSIPKGRTVRP